MARKGSRQYANPVLEAAARSAGYAYSGTRAAASKRIRENSELERAFAPRTPYRNGTGNFKERLGLNRRRRYLRSDRTVTIQRHRSDRVDPNTGFGINVNQVRKYKVGISGSIK